MRHSFRSAVAVVGLAVSAFGQGGDIQVEISGYLYVERESCRAVVKQVETLPDGSRAVRFHLSEKTEGRGQPKRHKGSQDLALTWRDAERPIPFVEGTEVSLGLDREGKIATVLYHASIALWRKISAPSIRNPSRASSRRRKGAPAPSRAASNLAASLLRLLQEQFGGTLLILFEESALASCVSLALYQK